MDNETTHKCPNCGVDVPDERIQALGVKTCKDCTPQPEKIYGYFQYQSKNTGELVILKDELLFKKMKRPINQQR